jgi:hypothetical protein
MGTSGLTVSGPVAEHGEPAMDDPRSARSFGRDHRLFLAGLLAVVLAILVVGARAALDEWLPTGDDGFFALRAHDVFSRHPPLLGTASSASTYAATGVNHPGPLQFDLLAVPVALFGIGAGTALGVALTNALAVVGVGWLVQRTAGSRAGLVAVVFMGGLAWALGSALLYTPWGPFAVLMPFGLFLVAVGVAAGGDVVALPVVVVVGSFVLQTHLSTVLLIPSLSLVAVAGVGFWLWRDRRGEPGAWAERRRHATRWGAVAAGLALICWSQPLVQELRPGRGNLTALLGTLDDPSPGTVTASRGLRELAGTVSLPPWWLPPGFQDPGPTLLALPPATWFLVSAAATGLVVAGLVWAVRSGWRRGDRLVVGAATSALVGLLVGYVTLLRAPAYGVMAPVYTRFLWPLAFWVWLSLALAVIRARPAPPIARRWAAPVGAALCVAVGVLALPTVDNGHRLRPVWERHAADFVDAALEAIDGRGPVLVRQVLSPASFTYGPLLMAEFAQHDVPFLVDHPELARQVGGHRVQSEPGTAAVEITIVHETHDAVPGGELIFQREALDPADQDEFEELAEELQSDLDRANPVRLTSGARSSLADAFPNLLEEFDRDAAGGTVEATQVAEIYLLVDLVNPEVGAVVDRDQVDPNRLARWAWLEEATGEGFKVYLLEN